MTNYIGPLGVQNCLDRLIARLGRDWFKSPYTRLSDVLSPSDRDMKIILQLRQKVAGDDTRHVRRHRAGSSLARLNRMYNTIEAQIRAGWTLDQIAKRADVSRATIINYIRSDAALCRLYRKRGNGWSDTKRVLQVVELYKSGATCYRIAKETGIDIKGAQRIVGKYKAGVLDEKDLQLYSRSD